jgi:hypothetical protein
MFHLASFKALRVDMGISVEEVSRVGIGLLVGDWIPGVISVGSRLAVHETVKIQIIKVKKLYVFMGATIS